MNISLAQGQKILCDPLCRSSYTDAVKVVWSALERLSGREKERESLLSEGQRLAQQPGEAVMAFLYRVNRYKQKCEFAGVTADTAHWLSLARVGMRDELSKKLSYLVNVGKPEVSWDEWLVSMERMAPASGSPSVRCVEAHQAVASSEVQAVQPSGTNTKKSGFRGRCFSCNQVGHMKRECPNRRQYRGQFAKEAMAAEGIEEVEDGRQSKPEADVTSSGQAEAQGSGTAIKISSTAFAVDCYSAVSRVNSFALGGEDEIPQVTLGFGSIHHSALLDTGSSCSLISASLVTELEGLDCVVRTGVPAVIIRYANGQEERAMGEAIIRTVMSGSECFLPFLIVPKLGRDGGIILGRRALRLLGMCIQFSQDAPKEREKLRKAFSSFSSPTDGGRELTPAEEGELCARIDCYSSTGELYIADDPALDLAGSRSSAGSQEEVCRDALDIKVGESLDRVREELAGRNLSELSSEDVVGRLLSAVEQGGPLPLSDGYTLRLVPGSVDGRDFEGQKFQFVTRWHLTEPSKETKGFWSSEGMLRRLSETELEEFEAHCEEYCKNGWWVPEQEASNHSDVKCPYGTIFPVRQATDDAQVAEAKAVCKTTKTRPVADLRSINSISPRVSNEQSTTAEAVRALRSSLKEGDSVRQYDLSRAFYCIGIEPTLSHGETVPLRLAVGRKRFECRRLAFGLACGPIVLRGSQRILVKIVHAARSILGHSGEVSIEPVMDDFLIWGDPQSVESVEGLLLLAWKISGFQCPDSKRTSWGTTPSRWLGSHWVWNGQFLQLQRPDAAVVDGESADHLTKRRVFQMAGKYTEISGGVNESLARAHADCARVLASAASTWDDLVSGNEWSKPCLVHLGLARQYWEAAAVEDKELMLFRGIKCVTAEVDASAAGYGFFWKDSESGRVIYSEAKVQSKSMAIGSWHCNRRELFAIAACLRKLDEASVLFKDLCRIEVLTDSRVAVSQADPWHVPACKSIEKRAIMRLRGVIVEVAHAFACSKPAVTVVFAHLPGKHNTIADALSRVALSLKYFKVMDEDSAVSVVTASCSAADVHSWLSTKQAGVHSVLAFRRWVELRSLFRAWRGDSPPTVVQPSLFREFLTIQQDKDGFCSKIVTHLDDQGRSLVPGLPYAFELRDGLLYRVRPNVPIDEGPRKQLVIPHHLIMDFAQAVHRESGHSGLTSTLAALYSVAWAPGLRKLVRKALRGCLSCALTRDNGTRAQISYGASRIPLAPFDCVGIDLYGPIRRPCGAGTDTRFPQGGDEDETSQKDGQQVLSVIDRLTGYCSFYLLDNGRAKGIADTLEAHFWRFGKWPRELWCDNAKSFVEATPLVSFLLMIGCQLKTIPAYTPQCGFWERRHREVSETLRSCLHVHPQASWRWLITIAEARANSVSGAHERLFGWKPQSPVVGALSAEIAGPLKVPRNFRGGEQAAKAEARARARQRDDILQVFAEEWLQARESLASEFTAKIHKRGGSAEVKVGDQVILFKPGNIKGLKLSPRATGPYEVMKKVSSQCYEIRLGTRGSSSKPPRSWMVHASRIRKFEPVGEGPADSAVDPYASESSDNICPSCREAHVGTLVCCDGCDRWFHVDCTDYDGQQQFWYCNFCGAARE
ncbi:retrovirus polyprotein, putative [Perkinsus marinus ATCC 50983]|uniref:Retrovirus polyprotein, putative n=1 Tax=Perkinsus marinus (strain ATCC 50983 / TXsc) TaxID=423536 RepID=C5KYR2_PERM5|nr:retrovirus polyprotein, putative [Perkinsus marinus ATCC 50983]EER10381.1 retrovirus polyprotein, putative [Perkinsus marinus ATCC 50983]|eukprot:XP_002778586.1 retrovirus polyprotein, putative [Perkinsus marinus ATCC 50983]